MTSSIYFLLNSDSGSEEEASPDPLHGQKKEEEAGLRKTEDEEVAEEDALDHLRGGRRGKGSLAYITHPQSLQSDLSVSDRFHEATQELCRPQPWRPSPSSLLPPSKWPAEPPQATGHSPSSSSTTSTTTEDHTLTWPPPRRRTSWSDDERGESTEPSTGNVSPISNSLPTSPHAAPPSLLDTVHRGTTSSSSSSSSHTKASPYSITSSPPPSGSRSAPPSPAPPTPSPPSHYSSPISHHPSPPSHLPTTARTPSPTQSTSAPQPTSIPPPASPQGELSYDKCLQLWTKQTEQRRSSQRVKRWQQFLSSVSPGEAEADPSETTGGEGQSSPTREGQQWIRGRTRRKPSLKGDETSATEEKERKTTDKRKESRRDAEGEGRTEDSSRDSRDAKRRKEEKRPWDFHLLQADEIRRQTEEDDSSSGEV